MFYSTKQYKQVNKNVIDLIEENRGVGSYYVQYPAQNNNDIATAFPVEDEPASLFGGTWVQVFDTEGLFFRTEGDPYGEGQNHERTDGKQTHQGQGHKHTGSVPGYSAVNQNRLTCQSGSSFVKHISLSISGPSNDGTNGTPKTGKENRSINRLIKIWRRTA